MPIIRNTVPMPTPTFPYTRLRRNRKAEWSRKLVAEHSVLVRDLILPIFIMGGSARKEPIMTMPGVYRYSVDEAIKYAKSAHELGILAIMLFPQIDLKLKTHGGIEAMNPENLVCKAIREIKANLPHLGVIVDVALDPYTSHGHDGITSDDGYVMNDLTIDSLCQQALLIAEAGADAVAPSDMMDGRVSKIRDCLEGTDFHNTQIIAYAAKYASSLFGPFRDAVGSMACLSGADKKNYQMDYANSDEAMAEIKMDINEGADMVIIKPAIPYLDIIYRAKERYNIPMIAYHVSGEYAMIKFAAQAGVIDEKSAFIEVFTSCKRAGARAIVTYAAVEVARWLSE